MIIFDENVDKLLIERIKQLDIESISIREYNPGISDREVIELTKSKDGILITEDKDFGELVFSYNIKGCSVIFLRYDKVDYDQIIKNLIKVLNEHLNSPKHHFITINRKKIRIRKI